MYTDLVLTNLLCLFLQPSQRPCSASSLLCFALLCTARLGSQFVAATIKPCQKSEEAILQVTNFSSNRFDIFEG